MRLGEDLGSGAGVWGVTIEYEKEKPAQRSRFLVERRHSLPVKTG
jgi:hypothetical protein